MRRGVVGAFVLSVLLVGSLAGGAVAQQAGDTDRFRGEPDLDAFAPESTFMPGERSELRIQIANDGRVRSGAPQERRELVTTARNVRVDVDADGTPIEIESDRQAVGSITENEPRSAPFSISVAEDAEPGTYSVDVELRYSYTAQVAPTSSVLGARTKERTRTVTRSVDVEIDDTPQFELRGLDAFAPESTLTPAERSELRIQIANDGHVRSGAPQERRELVTTARNVRVDVDADGTPIEIESDRQAVGSITENEPRSAPFSISVAEDAEPGTYSVDVELRYSYTAQIARTSSQLGTWTRIRNRTVIRSVDVEIDDSPRFELRNVSTDAQVGDSGTLAATVENVGGEAATDLRVAIESESGRLLFGGGASEVAFVDRLGPGETAPVEYDLEVSPEATLRDYALGGSVRFTDSDGMEGVDDDLSASVRPSAEQTFAFRNVSSDLRVSQDGTLSGTVLNEGPETVENVVVTLEPPAQNVEVLESEVALGTLTAGETADVSFDVEVASGAREGQRGFTLRTDYETARGDDRSTDPIRFDARVESRRDVFAVTSREATVSAGSTDRVVLEVTNQREETLTDVSAKLFASSPLSVPDDEAFVAELAPGETVEIPFRVAAAGGAMSKQYPLSVDFEYVDAAGETRLSESSRVPVTVEERDGGFFGFFDSLGAVSLATAGVLVGLPLGAYYRRR